MERIHVSYADPALARVIVNGQITLKFEKINGKVWKTGSSRSGFGSLVVARPDFDAARSKAIEAMDRAVKFQNVTDKDIAERILKNAERDEISINTAVDSFFASAEWCNPERKGGVWKAIGEIGGIAAKHRAEVNAIKKQAGKDNRQHDLFGGGGSGTS